ncbi:IS3 family transposase [Arthrobacter sp. NPDC057013]|uniref:IS3 family transposase n=1 Tax=Arthrobacter sp. NPDC057013 TaxID=3345999 RepID=UPI003645C380
MRAGAIAPGKRTVAGRSGLSGKNTGLEGSKTTVKVQALIALKADFSLPVLLQVSGLARSTFFYHQTRLQAPDPQETLKTAITDIFTTNHGRYGHRRIHTELLKQRWVVAKKSVLKLMRSLGLLCKVRRRKRYNSYQGEQGTAAPNLLNREFDATAPNQKWVTDVTEFNVGDRKLYFSPVMNLFDRQIISRTVGTSPNLEPTNTSLRQALNYLQPGQQPLVHSGQGSSTATPPGAPFSRTPAQSNQCPARATATTMR